MKNILLSIALFVSTALQAATYTQTECRFRSVEGQWIDLSGFVHHLNVSHTSNTPGTINKVHFELAKYINDGVHGWQLANYWDEMYAPQEWQLGWSIGDIEDRQVGYILRVWFNNGSAGYVPTAAGNALYTMSVRPNGDQYYWHEWVVAPPPTGVFWADYRINIYGQWVLNPGTLVNYDWGWSTIPGIAPNLWTPTPPLGYFN